ncbi:stage II sporulation protein M [Lacipirellula limnantheis]|uniref:Stage II sporulation protein M n=1 Tax=Lacipirellula limnantheis TaxID=2528024 RepID=A0A517U1W0_9BACT|nr:stage II sporulation protein M [Lacipirellula limnantheis]QDT74607.1 hypothetical protein I41_38040 [Lacipirellula limnantheis]
MSHFFTRNKPIWDELDQLVQRARRSPKSLSPEELSRLDSLYRRTTIHLAQVSTRSSDRQLQQYLNNLASAAHSIIYLPPRQSIFQGAWQFANEGFARLIMRNWRYHLASAMLLLSGALLAFFASLSDPVAAYALMPMEDPRQPGASREQLLEVLRSGREQGGGEKFFFASFLFTHNLKIGILALGLGALAAVPTVFLMVFNGMLIGSFVAIHYRAGLTTEMWAWILPHGVTEIGAIILCGGVGLRLGQAVISPGLLSRMESLRRAGVEAGATAIGVAGMLLAAAIIESFLRQSHLPTNARLAFAAATAIFWALYLLHGAIRERQCRRREDLLAGTPALDDRLFVTSAVGTR